MVGRGGEPLIQNSWQAKKNVKGNLPKIMKIRLGVGVVLYLNFDFTVHFLVFDSIFYKVSKKGGGQLHGNSNLREIFGAKNAPPPRLPMLRS